MDENYFERDEPMSCREGYDYDDIKATSGFEEGEYYEEGSANEPIYSTVKKPKISTSSRYDKDEGSQHGSEGQKQGIIRRPDSRSSKNVTFDAAPTVQQVDTGYEDQIAGQQA